MGYSRTYWLIAVAFLLGLMPSIANAQGNSLPKPVLHIDPKLINLPYQFSLATEQAFLEAVYSQSWMITQGKRNWKKIEGSSPRWILDVPDFQYVGKTEPIRFVMVSVTNHPDEWYLYAHRFFYGKWL